MTALLKLAEAFPDWPTTHITERPDSTEEHPKYNVLLYTDRHSSFPVTVELDLTRGYNQAGFGNVDANGKVEIWALVYETAIAQHMDGYGAIGGGGYTDVIWKLLTGRGATRINVVGMNDEQIATTINNALGVNGQQVAIGSIAGAPNIPGTHCLSVIGANAANGFFALWNLWGGSQGPTTILFDRLSENVGSVYILQTN